MLWKKSAATFLIELDMLVGQEIFGEFGIISSESFDLLLGRLMGSKRV